MKISEYCVICSGILEFFCIAIFIDRYVPLSKKSKKEQKKFHAMQRNTWGGLNPVTRIVPNGKAYNRNKQKQEDRRKDRDFRYEGPAFFMPDFRAAE